MIITHVAVVAFDAGDSLAHVRTRWSELATRHNIIRLAVPPREMMALRIGTDSGAEGCAVLANPGAAPAEVERQIGSVLLGEDALYREWLWLRMREAKTPWRVLSAADIALWDLAGKVAGLPAWQLAGGCRDKAKVYVATHPEFGTPDDYAAHALACKRRGYRGYKVHGYMGYDPVKKESIPLFSKAFPEQDIEICRAIRAAVGDEFPLMHDPAGMYDLDQSLWVGRELEKLNFEFFESPMPEKREWIEAYATRFRRRDVFATRRYPQDRRSGLATEDPRLRRGDRTPAVPWVLM